MVINPRGHGTYAIPNTYNTIRAKNAKLSNRLHTPLRAVA